MKTWPDHVAVGDTPEILKRILEPNINLAMWQRKLNPKLIFNLKKLSYDQLPGGYLAPSLYIDSRVYIHSQNELNIPSLKNQLFIKLLMGKRPNTKEETIVNKFLLEDIIKCSKIFYKISRSISKKNIDIELRKNSKKQQSSTLYFHYDFLSLRLLVAYQGQGAQWLPNQEINQKNLFGKFK